MLAEQEAPSLPTDLSGYMAQFGPAMGRRVGAMFKPLYDPVLEGETEAMQLLANSRMVPFLPQAVRVEAIVRAMRRDRAVTMVGEMGTGKTAMGLWVAKLLAYEPVGRGRLTGKRLATPRPIRVAITCPNQLVDKWARHAHDILPNAIVKITKSFTDLQHFDRQPKAKQNEVWIFSRDRTKLSYSWRLGVRPQYVSRRGRRFSERLCCPKCGNTLVVKNKRGYEENATIDDFAKNNRPSYRKTCSANVMDGQGRSRPCGEQLWQAFNGRACPNGFPVPGTAPRRYAPAEFVQRQLGVVFDLYIADEWHELKGANTLQGQMFGIFARASRRVLAMTGTLSGGYAENVETLIWRTAPDTMRHYGIEHTEEGHRNFIRRYGVLQKTVTMVAESRFDTIADLVRGRGKKQSVTEKSLPGISPILFSQMLMPNTVFLRLAELHDHLPAFNEFVHSVNTTPAMDLGLRMIHGQFKAHLSEMRSRGKPCRVSSSARHMLLRWSDLPFRAEKVIEHIDDGEDLLAFESSALPTSAIYPKEKKLIELVQAAKRAGRKVWIFTDMTGDRWDVTTRLQSLLARYGLRAEILRSQSGNGPKPEDREKWIAEKTPSCDAMISNPNLVKTGLDLFDYPTIVFYFTGDNTYTLRQAARRAWRLGQRNACEVHYLVYGGLDEASKPLSPDSIGDAASCLPAPYVSIQSAALSLMSKKMAASAALEGDFSSEGLSAMAGESEDVQTALARVIAGTLQVEDPNVAFKRYREALEKAIPSLARGSMPSAPKQVPIVSEPVRTPSPLTQVVIPTAEAKPAAATPTQTFLF
jgi:hypothetical protein